MNVFYLNFPFPLHIIFTHNVSVQHREIIFSSSRLNLASILSLQYKMKLEIIDSDYLAPIKVKYKEKLRNQKLLVM